MDDDESETDGTKDKFRVCSSKRRVGACKASFEEISAKEEPADFESETVEPVDRKLWKSAETSDNENESDEDDEYDEEERDEERADDEER